MEYRKVTDTERRQIQLDMLKEIDSFCRANQIRCSLSNGTLLGAVRHGGYIPWDDDVDICMPLPDTLRFKKIFSSATMKYCDIDIDNHYEFAFPRIVYTPTFSRQGIFVKSYGISIDIYPVLGLPPTKEEVNLLFDQLKALGSLRRKLRTMNRRLRKYLPIRTIPGSDALVRKYRDKIISYPYNNSKYLFHYGGDIKWSKVFEEDLFIEMTELLFEGEKFMVFGKYDDYLRHVYGDYMQLPPIEKRQYYHGTTNIYWKR